MKTMRSQKIIAAAEELSAVIESRKALEKRERELKDLFKVELGDEKVGRVGNYVIMITDCQTSTIHRDRLIADMGLEWVHNYTQITKYKKVTIQGG